MPFAGKFFIFCERKGNKTAIEHKFSQKIKLQNFIAVNKQLTYSVQPWESATAFSNAVTNAILYWLYDGKNNAVVKDFTSVVFIFTFYSTVDYF